MSNIGIENLFKNTFLERVIEIVKAKKFTEPVNNLEENEEIVGEMTDLEKGLFTVFQAANNARSWGLRDQTQSLLYDLIRDRIKCRGCCDKLFFRRGFKIVRIK